MKESHLRKVTVQLLREAGQDPISVENLVGVGTPDVNYVGGWIELKVLEKWPVRPSTPVRLPKLTQEQRIWLARRWARDGQAHLLLAVAHEWLLFTGISSFHAVGYLNRQDLYDEAVAHWEKAPTSQELLEALRKRPC